jgi:serine/threonine-protein kinase
MNNTELDSFIDRFETAYAEDPRVDICEFAPESTHEHYHQIVTELIRVELELAWNTDRSKPIDEYTKLFPKVLQDKECFDRIAFEEYRLRIAAGESVTPQDYQTKYAINAYHWPVLDSPQTNSESFKHNKVPAQVDDQGSSREGAIDTPTLSGGIFDGQVTGPPTVESTLQNRLRFISLTLTLSLLYLAILVWANPVTKVGLFLGSPWLVWLNGFILIVCSAICATLWSRRNIKLSNLRILEVLLFGSVLAELSCGLASDLFADFELAVPFYEGEHKLFHYASSWSLPFFALIVAYGTLVPSSWLRCTIIVSVIGILPIAISTAAAVSLHSFSTSFFQSFLMQMIIWMSTAAGIAIYGVRRLEETQYQLHRSGKLGKYRLIRQISSGGMGSVYEAEHTMLNRQCAIKLILPRWSLHPHLLARFQREVQVLAGIAHPNVVQIHDFGFTNEGVFYFVMEFLDGKNLEESVQENGPLTPSQVIQVLLQMTDALDGVHQSGIVHRDVKPSNIFLCNSPHGPTAKLLDFGLTKSESVLESDQQLTQDGAIIGTPAYMSPEQASGDIVDHRTDLYSLGAVAHFSLTGKRVFERPTSVETLTAHINSKPPLLTGTTGTLPKNLQEVVHRCLAKDPRCRFQSAAELRDLQAIASN